MFQILVEWQRTIYLAVGEQIKLLSAGGDWLAFMGFLPMGVVFG
ncbi:MAG: ABC transporter permease, partial [Mesorhizobium sp.]